MGRTGYLTLDHVYRDLLARLGDDPDHVCSPRGQKIHELLPFSFTLLDPRARLIHNEARQMKYGFGVGEFLWYWAGKNDLETMRYYNKRMAEYSDDGKTLNSAYGHRLRSPVHPSRIWPEEVGPKRLDPSQWAIAAGTLIDDPDSRRAVLLINNPEDEYVARMNGSKDVPCTLSLQFFVRENKLELHAVMRSNDVVWGMPYDVFSFTLFQELMMLELRQHPRFKDLELGPYHHTAGSLHLYERHFGDAKKIVEEYGKKELMFVWPKPMEPLQPVMVECLLEEEELLRTGDERAVMDSALRINVYPEPLRWMADQLGKHRIKRDMEKRA